MYKEEQIKFARDIYERNKEAERMEKEKKSKRIAQMLNLRKDRLQQVRDHFRNDL